MDNWLLGYYPAKNDFYRSERQSSYRRPAAVIQLLPDPPMLLRRSLWTRCLLLAFRYTAIRAQAEALALYERAAREEPKNPMPHYYLGYAYKDHKQRAKAAEEFKRFLQLKPDAPERKDIEMEIEDLGGK